MQEYTSNNQAVVEELRTVLPKPALMKLQEMGDPAIKVDQVMGNRLLVKTVKPFTKMDEVEKSGLLYVPDTVKERNTPLPCTGVVIKLGAALGDRTACPANFVGETQLVQEGSYIMFSKYAGSDAYIGGEEDLRIMSLDEVMCTLTIPPLGVVPVKEDK